MSEIVNKNQLLLFGDFGTEVIRLSQLYIPENCIWQPVGDAGFNSGLKYAVPAIRQKTVFFDVCEGLTKEEYDATKATTQYYYYEEDNEGKEQSRYVPVPQTLVVVDSSKDYAHYTLMVVDWVEDGDESYDQVFQEWVKHHPASEYIPTYASHLKPINFTGGVDQATRVVDYLNDRLMLYVEDITPVNSEQTVQRLVPDRKLMMYGPRPLVYDLRLGDSDVILNTNDLGSAASQDEQLANYVSAMFRPVVVKTEQQYESLVGTTVQYIEIPAPPERAHTVTAEVHSGDTDLMNKIIASCNAGYAVHVITNSDDALVQVQLPDPCYLRSTCEPLVSNDVVTMNVYECDEQSETRRCIMSVKLHVRTGSSLDTADLRKGIVTGFDVLVGNEATPRDVWNFDFGTTKKNVMSIITPYLLLDDGSNQTVDTASPALKIYGLEELDRNPVAGTEFEVLFKYFPYAAAGFQPTMDVNTRYAPTKDAMPNTDKQYFLCSNHEWRLATEEDFNTSEESGQTVVEFKSSLKYYEKIRSLSWNGVVNRPARDFLICRKRVVINVGLSAQRTTVRHISTIPVWDRMTESWDFKFLAYMKDYSVPRLITKDPDDIGFVSGVEGLPYGPMDDDPDETDDIYFANMTYHPNLQVEYAPVKNLTINVRHFKWMPYRTSSELSDKDPERWLIGGKGSADPESGWTNRMDRCPYGRHAQRFGRKRPILECWTEIVAGKKVAKFQIPADMHPSLTGKNEFIEQFYKPALDDDDTWAAEVEPNCFRIRAVEDGIRNGVMTPADEITSEYLVISEESGRGEMSYTASFECDGIKIPTDPSIEKEYIEIDGEMVELGKLPTIAIVEFAYRSNGQTLTLLGVPVEIYRIAKNPAED